MAERDEGASETDQKGADFLARLAEVGEGVAIFANALILKPELVTISDGTRIDDFARIEGGLGVSIGSYVHIASYASILGGGEAELGDFVGLAQGARIITGGGHPFFEKMSAPPPAGDPFARYRGRVRLDAYSFVAANAVVLPDVSLGEGAFVAAGSVATSDVEPWTIVAGSPARPVKRRDEFVTRSPE